MPSRHTGLQWWARWVADCSRQVSRLRNTHLGRPSLAATLCAQAATLDEAMHLHVGQPLLGNEPLEATRVLLHEEVAEEERRLVRVRVRVRVRASFCTRK